MIEHLAILIGLDLGCAGSPVGNLQRCHYSDRSICMHE
jgi:hypothetical protein